MWIVDALSGRMKEIARSLVAPELRSKHENVVILLSLVMEKNVEQKHNLWLVILKK